MKKRMNAEVDKNTAEALEHLLADSYTLYLKTQNYHWNVTGPMFTTLHTLFEGQYTELAMAVDEIAERIRALGERAPGSYVEFAKLASVQESTSTPGAMAMVEDLVGDMGRIRETATRVLDAAEASGDAVSADLATRRMDVAEKAAWMLRSHQE
jgi:starvation-inducible DNA-binding protein